MEEFITKDSGQRQEFSSGMVRDVTTGKPHVALAFDGPMFWRWVMLLTRGAIKYAVRNWMKADGEQEYERFKESAVRHFYQWYRGDIDEDHAAAVFFNINGAEYVREKIKLNTPKNIKPTLEGVGIKYSENKQPKWDGVVLKQLGPVPPVDLKLQELLESTKPEPRDALLPAEFAGSPSQVQHAPKRAEDTYLPSSATARNCLVTGQRELP